MQECKLECIVYLLKYLVDLGDNDESMGLIYLNTFWNDNVMTDYVIFCIYIT